MEINQEVIGFFFNQHLEFGNESDYFGNSSCFFFKFVNNRIQIYKPIAGMSKYFRVSSQGIFIGMKIIVIILKVMMKFIIV